MSRILAVDDDLSVCQMLETVLRGMGYEVVACNSGLEALDLLRSSGEQFDLLLADLKMEHMDGIALMKAARQDQPSLGAIIITGHGASENAILAMDAGADDYLTKPFHLSDLKASIEAALDKRLDEP